MENLNLELTPAMLAMVPIVAATIQMLKRIPAIEKLKEWIPLLSVAMSCGFMYYQGAQNFLLAGTIIGLTACGGFDALKQKKENAVLST